MSQIVFEMCPKCKVIRGLMKSTKGKVISFHCTTCGQFVRSEGGESVLQKLSLSLLSQTEKRVLTRRVKSSIL